MLKLEPCAYVMKFDIMSKVFEWIFMSHFARGLPASQPAYASYSIVYIWGFPLFRSICDSILGIQFSMHTYIKSLGKFGKSFLVADAVAAAAVVVVKRDVRYVNGIFIWYSFSQLLSLLFYAMNIFLVRLGIQRICFHANFSYIREMSFVIRICIYKTNKKYFSNLFINWFLKPWIHLFDLKIQLFDIFAVGVSKYFRTIWFRLFY